MSDGIEEGDGARGGEKSPRAYRTIAEVSEELDLPQHVLRFWESKFSQLRPLKRRGGRRYYRPEDVVLLQRIRALLYGDGYTIRGVQKLLREGAIRPPAAERKRAPVLPEAMLPLEPSPPAPPCPFPAAAAGDMRQNLEEILAALEEVRGLLGRSAT